MQLLDKERRGSPTAELRCCSLDEFVKYRGRYTTPQIVEIYPQDSLFLELPSVRGFIREPRPLSPPRRNACLCPVVSPWVLPRWTPRVHADTEFDGSLWIKEGLRVKYLPQEPDLDASLDVMGNIRRGIAEQVLGRDEAPCAGGRSGMDGSSW